MRLYRFELAFDGQPQNVGLFQDLEAISPRQAQQIRELFNELPVPDLNAIAEKAPVSSWFTEQGIYKFLPQLKQVNDWLTGRGWNLAGAAIDVSPAMLVYRDEHQAAIMASCLWGLEYHVLDGADEVLRLTPIPVRSAPNRAKMAGTRDYCTGKQCDYCPIHGPFGEFTDLSDDEKDVECSGDIDIEKCREKLLAFAQLESARTAEAIQALESLMQKTQDAEACALCALDGDGCQEIGGRIRCSPLWRGRNKKKEGAQCPLRSTKSSTTTRTSTTSKKSLRETGQPCKNTSKR